MDIKKELNDALTMLGAIMVSGDAVESPWTKSRPHPRKSPRQRGD